MVPKEYYGRLFTKEQLPVDYHSEAFTLESMIKVDKQLRCKRCYSQIEEDWQLPGGQYYCRACIVFGRNQEGKELYYFPSKTSEIEISPGTFGNFVADRYGDFGDRWQGVHGNQYGQWSG